MNSIILKDQNGVITDPQVLEHLHSTLKLNIGDEIKVTVLDIGVGSAVVKSINAKECQVEIRQLVPGTPQWVDLIIGVSRPQTLKKVIEHGTTYGAKSFHFYKAQLSEKSYLDSKVFENNSFEELTTLGLAQSTIYDSKPSVKTYKYNPAKNFENYEQKYILDLNGNETFSDLKIDFSLPIALSIGPERGFAESDLAHFTNAGFKSIKISKTILRVEHAVYSAIAQLEMLKRNF